MVLSPLPTLIQTAEVIIELPLASPRGQVIRKGKEEEEGGKGEGNGRGKEIRGHRQWQLASEPRLTVALILY